MHAQAGLGRIGLQVKGGGLDGPLLIIRQAAEAGGERVGDAELHEIPTTIKPLFLDAARGYYFPWVLIIR